jgi:hypothetical protein
MAEYEPELKETPKFEKAEKVTVISKKKRK